MASARGDLKNFFRQKKKISTGIGGGISKQSKKPASTFPLKKSPVHSATLGSDATQPPALISHGSLDLPDNKCDDKYELILKEFDMNMAYGPCLGITRLDRWERAVRLSMNPSKEVESLLKTGKVSDQCLWDGRV